MDMADPTVAAETCVALGATEHQFESFPGRDIALGCVDRQRVLSLDVHVTAPVSRASMAPLPVRTRKPA